MRRFSCPACLEVVDLPPESQGKKGECPECGKEVRWAKPIKRAGSRRWAMIGLALMCVPVAILCIGLIRQELTRKVYTDAELSRAVMGKTEDDVRKLLGEPHVTDTEPSDSPQAGKRCIGYALARTQGWSMAGRDGAVAIFFSPKTKKADHIEYIAKPRERNGRIIIEF